MSNTDAFNHEKYKKLKLPLCIFKNNSYKIKKYIDTGMKYM